MNWNANLKTLAGLLSIIGSIAGGSIYVGHGVYEFAKSQTHLIEHVEGVEKAVNALAADTNRGLEAANRGRETAIQELRTLLEPRINTLERDSTDAKASAAATKQRVDDMAESLNEIKGDVKDALGVSRDIQRITKSHDEDIKATRQAIAPR